MVHMIDGVAWVLLEGHYISAIYQQQPHMYLQKIPYYDEFQLITYEVIWASLTCNVGGEVFGDLVLILPLEGIIFAAQVQISLHTYHQWRQGKCGVGYRAYHVQHFSPPILQEPKVEDDF